MGLGTWLVYIDISLKLDNTRASDINIVCMYQFLDNFEIRDISDV